MVSLFAGDPQPVEIHHRGIWFSGELLGWTHTDEGRVLARVRCVVDGLRHSTWKDLAELRLPDPARPPRREPFPWPPRPVSWASPAAASTTDDATRPHALLAGSRSRPQKPEHAQHAAGGARAGHSPSSGPAPASGRSGPVANPNRRRSDELSPV